MRFDKNTLFGAWIDGYFDVKFTVLSFSQNGELIMSRLFKGLIAMLSLILVGCTGGQQTTSVSLPLATNQPTFIFFYTDN